MFLGRRAIAAVVSICALTCGADALAYRPFEGTDAAVADLGELETELGPAEPLRTGSLRLLTAPETVFNLGIAEGWDAVLQGQAVTLLSPGPAQTSLIGNEFSLKTILRDGVLYQSGPQRRYGGRPIAAGRQRRARHRRDLGWDRVISLGMADGALQLRRDRDPQPSRRRLYRHHRRGTLGL